MFILLLTISLVLFLILLVAFVYRLYEVRSIPIASAAAGDVRINAPRIQKLLNLNTQGFYDENHMRLDFQQYKHFVVCGNSMLLAGIEDGDILFVEEQMDNCQELKFPCILVLQREHFSFVDTNSPLYKIRRAWGVYDLSDSNVDLLKQLDEIMESSDFKDVIDLGVQRGYVVDKEDIKNDFINNRWMKYQKYYPSCKRKDKNHKIILSTTLDTKRNLIHFSIHPCHCVMGKVLHSFRLRSAM